MSDTESGDDGFDREAEKERLREKYEQEKQDRQATQQMSELLLQGATMTNKHCDDCGDPVFRYQGQEFCPTCGQEVAEDGQAGGAEQAAGADAGAGAVDSPAPEAGEDATETAADDSGVETAAGAAGVPAPQAGSASAGTDERTTEPTTQQPAAGGDLQTARDALVRKLARLAQQAEATDDVGRSRDLLAAAKEAAEALAAVDRIGR